MLFAGLSAALFIETGGRSLANTFTNFPAGPQREMAEAVGRGDLATVRRLLESGSVEPDAVGDNRVGWLAIAIAAERRDVFEYLLEAGAVGAPQSDAAGAAMYQATVADDEKWLRGLVEAGASLDGKGGGERLILVAARTKLPGRLEFYIEQGAQIDARVTGGETPAYDSALSQNYTALETLLDAGASPWVASARGVTLPFLLERAARNPVWDMKSEHEALRQRLVARLVEAGVPYPAPPPAEVLRRIAAGTWGPS